MKKTLIAAAVLAASGAAFAQSSVTLFGIVDAGIQYGKSNADSITVLGNSGYNSSRLGFRGVEDLGGGMRAEFWQEGSLSNDEGTSAGLKFQRKSTVALAGGFGEVRLGRDYTPTFYNASAYDAFGTNGVGTNIVATKAWGMEASSLRASNSISYFTPNMSGFQAQLMYVLPETSSTAAVKEGQSTQIRGVYNQGPISASVAYGVTKRAAGDSKVTNLGASYNFGMAKLMGMYEQDKIATVTGKGFNIGVTAPVGAGEVRASLGQYKIDSAKTNKFAVGYVHNLSKRTALYTTVARVSNSGGADVSLNGSAKSANNGSTGFDLGVRHSF